MQWGIKTVVGLPIPSSNVGRIVLVLYSCLDRPKDHDLVGQLCEELAKVGITHFLFGIFDFVFFALVSLYCPVFTS